MKRSAYVLAAVLIVSLGLSGPASAIVHQINKEVGIIMPPDSRDCVFFQLVGVSEPDPVAPGLPWIAVPRSHVGFKEIYAFLLWAKGAGARITVETSGQTLSGCGGMVGVWQVYSAS